MSNKLISLSEQYFIDLDKKYKVLTKKCSSNTLKFITLKDLKSLKVNSKVRKELQCFGITQVFTKVMEYVTLRFKELYPKRLKRLTLISQLLKVFYTLCYESLSGHVMPSMKTLSYYIDPSIKNLPAKEQTKALGKLKMKISRTVKDLEKLYILKPYMYYASQANYKRQYGSFSYALTPPSYFLNMKVTIAQVMSASVEAPYMINAFSLIKKENAHKYKPKKSTKERIHVNGAL